MPKHAVKRALERAVKRARALERALSYFGACSFYITYVTATNAGACIEAPVDLQALSYSHASVKLEMRRHKTWVFKCSQPTTSGDLSSIMFFVVANT